MIARPHFQKLVEQARLQVPLAAAVVFPCDRESLQLALSGAFASFLAPTLVGPEDRIRDLAGKSGLDISRLPIVDTPDDARAAGERAAELASTGAAAALIKGSLGIDLLLSPVADPQHGLRTERRLSHAYFLDLPGQDRGLLFADAQLNVTPNLAAKRDIVQNTIALAQALGMSMPRVALLAAMDGPAPAFPSTTEAVALTNMAAEGMFEGAIVSGPITPDGALSPEAARTRGLTSEVAGRADALIAPSMESALMVLRTLLASGGGLAAGIVLGARVPIVAPGRHDNMEVRMASCVLASLVATMASASRQRDGKSSDAAAAAVETGARVAA